MTLPDGQALLPNEIRRAGPDGVLWSSHNGNAAQMLRRKGLVEYRLGELTENVDGRKTAIRYVAAKQAVE